MAKRQHKDKEITNPFYGMPLDEACKTIFKAGKPKKATKKKVKTAKKA